MKVFGREPTVVLQGVAAAAGLVVTFKLPGLTAENAGAIVALLTAVLGAVNAALVRPVAPAAFTAVVATGATLLATYGFHATLEQIGAVQALTIAVLTLIVRSSVTPKADPVPTAPATGTVS